MEPKFFEAEGHDINGRKLTVEEQTRPITGQRFLDWMRAVGEDYVDQNALSQKSFYLFVGFLLHKYPEKAVDLLRIANDKYGEALTLENEIYATDGDDTEDGYAKFYADLAEFINLTENLKAQTNANLILVTEHYGH